MPHSRWIIKNFRTSDFEVTCWITVRIMSSSWTADGGTVVKVLRYNSGKVTGSIPDGVVGIFHWHNPSDRTIALGSTQPLTEMNTRSISWG
jgi:hypothetical protein